MGAVFVASKVAWALAQPSNLLLAALLCGVVLAATGARWRRRGLMLAAAAAAAFTAAAALPLGDWALAPLERRFPQPVMPERVDGIIVLGGMVNQFLAAEHGQPALTDASERLVAFVELGRAFPAARLIAAGGSGSLAGQDLKEGPVIADTLRRLGFPADRVRFETASRNTRENVVNARTLAAPGPGERWLLVTSAFHVPRAVGIFRTLGWPVVPWPVDYRTGGANRWSPGSLAFGLSQLDLAAREWTGLVAYRVLGWTDDLIPDP